MNNDNLKMSPSKKWLAPKALFVVLGVVIAAEVIFAIRTLTQPTPAPLPRAKEVSIVASISLASNKTNYSVGDSVPIIIKVDTGGHKTAGSDVILHFDPKALEASGAASFVKGVIYKDYPHLEVSSKGRVAVSGIGPADANFSGAGVLSTVNLKAKAKGVTKVTVEFTPPSSTDSNILDSESSQDILEKVEDLNLIIK